MWSPNARGEMTSLSTTGSHAVQFYANEAVVHHAIAEFFTQGTALSDPLILVARRRTFRAVAEQLAADRCSPDTTARIQFFDAEDILPQIMDGETFKPERAQYLFEEMLLKARPSHTEGTIRLYGETVDILCQHGHHAVGLQMEDLAGMLLDMEPRLSILCGYALERFEEDAHAACFRAVCQKHSHVMPAERFSNPEPTIYVIDDNSTLRRALGRLLIASHWPVRTFNTAEALLAELDQLPIGCLVVDVQLPGMSGLELIRRLTDAGLSWPIIVISGLHDPKTESDALRLGARAYLRKPFSSDALLNAVARAFL